MNTLLLAKPAERVGSGPGSVADAVAALLLREGTDVVFTVPGGPVMPLLEAITRASTIRVRLCSSEGGAVFAADCYARVSGRIGVAVVTSGPGALNALTGLAVAYADRVPVLVLSGQVATSTFGHGAAQDSSPLGVDVVAMAAHVTALSVGLGAARQAVSLLSACLRTAWCTRRPVHLSLPLDVQTAPALPASRTNDVYRIDEFGAYDPTAVARAARVLGEAERVAILVGRGGRGAGPELLHLAELLGAALVTSPAGKGCADEHHPHHLGVFGLAGTVQASAALLDSGVDALLVVGCSLGENATHNWSDALRTPTLIQVDRDATQLCRVYPALGVVGDARPVAIALLHALSREEAPQYRPRDASWVTAMKHKLTAAREEALASALSWQPRHPLLHPTLVMHELQAAMPDDAIVLVEVGNSMGFALHHLVIGRGQQFILNLNVGSMGHSFGGALGARHAAPARAVIALVGDAAFAMNGFEVHAAVESQFGAEARGGPVFLVMANGGNGMVARGAAHHFHATFGPDFGMYRVPLQIAAIAAGMGARHAIVDAYGELQPAIERALQPGIGPTVLEIRIDPAVPSPIDSRLSGISGQACGGSEHR
jgi:acetolactate synthase I/II/III large subunit